MKKTLLFVSIIFLAACASSQKLANNNSKPKATKNAKGNLVGYATKNDFKQEPYGSEWFNDYYEYYETDKSVVNKLKPLLTNITIKGFMGTWCDDSRRETPNFYKILDETGFDYNKLDLVTVNREKTANGIEKGYDIERVPTFIFFKNGKEIGRFVEHTVDGASLEQDMLLILSKKGYKHAYEK